MYSCRRWILSQNRLCVRFGHVRLMGFKRQMNTARNLYGNQLLIPVLSRTDISEILQPLLEYYSERDRGIISDRVTECVLARQKLI